MPAIRALPSVLVTALALTSLPAFAAEGTIAVRDGDVVTGRLDRCGDFHGFEVQLAKGDILKARVDPTTLGGGSVHVRVHDPAGFLVNEEARVRLRGDSYRVGPFRAPHSGLYRVGIGTGGPHGVGYEARLDIRHRGKRVVTLNRRRPGRSVIIPAGALLRVKAKGDAPSLSLRLPGEEPRTLGADDPLLAALMDGGLSAPCSGLYDFVRGEGARKLRVIVTPPKDAPTRNVRFPDLPDDRPELVDWYDSAGWLPAGTPAQPGEQPAETPWADSLVGLPAAGPQAPAEEAQQIDSWVAGASLGRPLAGIPTVEEIIAGAVVEPSGEGPVYRLRRTGEDIGDVAIRVQFLVEGRAVTAPLALDGRVSMRWWTSGSEPEHDGHWTLRMDEDRGVQVLDGAENWVDEFNRVYTSSATGFALMSDGGWPSGSLSWGVSHGPASFGRIERYDGSAAAEVTLIEDRVLQEPLTFDMGTGLQLR